MKEKIEKKVYNANLVAENTKKIKEEINILNLGLLYSKNKTHRINYSLKIGIVRYIVFSCFIS